MITQTTETLLRDVRAACDGNADALEWLDEVESALWGQARVERLGPRDAQAELAAWNTWATQGEASCS